MVELVQLNSINHGVENSIWGVIQDDWINQSASETTTGVGSVEIEIYDGDLTSDEKRGLMKIQLPEQPDGFGPIKRIILRLSMLKTAGLFSRDMYIAKKDFGEWRRGETSWDHRFQSSVTTNGIGDWPAGAGGPDSNDQNNYNDDYVAKMASSILNTLPTSGSSIEVIELLGKIDWGSTFDLLFLMESGSAAPTLKILGKDTANINDMPAILIEAEYRGPDKLDFLDDGIKLGLELNRDRQSMPIFKFDPDSEDADSFLNYIVGVYDKNLIRSNLDKVGIKNDAFKQLQVYNASNRAALTIRVSRDISDTAKTFEVSIKGLDINGVEQQETISFTGATLDDLDSVNDYTFLYHIEVTGFTPPLVGLKFYIRHAGTGGPAGSNQILITHLPDIFSGVAFTNLNVIDVTEVKLYDAAINKQQFAINTENEIHFYSIWRNFLGKANEVQTLSTTAIEVDFTNSDTITVAPREIPKGIPSNSGDVGEILFNKITVFEVTPLGKSITHIDVSYFENDDGDVEVFQRIPLKRPNVGDISIDNEFEFIYSKASPVGDYVTQYRFSNPDIEFATPWNLLGTLGTKLDINPRDPLAQFKVHPFRARIGDLITIDGSDSASGASNEGISKFESSRWEQDFSGDGGSIADPLASHSPLTNPTRSFIYTKIHLGNTYPKIIRIKMKVTSDSTKTSETVAEILVSDNVAQPFREFLQTETGLMFLGELRKRDNTILRVSHSGQRLIDQGFAGLDMVFRGFSGGDDFLPDLEAVRALHDSQTYLSISPPELSREGRIKTLKGVLTGNLQTDHSEAQRVEWSVPFHVEKELVTDADGKIVITLICGDDLINAGLGYMVDSAATDIFDGSSKSPSSSATISIQDVITGQRWDPAGVIAVGSLQDGIMDGDYVFGSPTAFDIGAGVAGAPSATDGRFRVKIRIDADRPFRIILDDGVESNSGQTYNPTVDQMIAIRGLQSL